MYLVPGEILIRPDYDHRLEQKGGKVGGGGIRTRIGRKKHGDKVFRMVYITIKERAHIRRYQQVQRLSNDIHTKTILISCKACGAQFTGILNKQ